MYLDVTPQDGGVGGRVAKWASDDREEKRGLALDRRIRNMHNGSSKLGVVYSGSGCSVLCGPSWLP